MVFSFGLTVPNTTYALTDQEKIYLESYGWIIGQQGRVAQLGLNDDEFQAFVDGLDVARQGKSSPHNIQLVGPDMNAYLKDKAEAYRKTFKQKQQKIQNDQSNQTEKVLEENRKKAKAFIEDLMKKNSEVQKTDSGLLYEIIKKGKGKPPAKSDTVTVNYEGRFVDGTVFDSTFKREKPATLPLNKFIEGWQEGLQLIGKGGKINLYVPAKLGYGDDGRMGMPPGALLIFDVELLNIERKGDGK